MFQLSNIKNIASNVLDLLFVNDLGDIQLCQASVAITELVGIVRFHPPLEITFEYQATENSSSSSSNETVEVFVYSRGNYERMTQQLNAINFAHIFDRMDVVSAFDYFYCLMDRLIMENVPRTKRKKKNNKPKWWTRELQKKKNKRDKMYKNKPKNIMTPEYTEALKDFNILQDSAYNEYIAEVQENIFSNPSEFWSYAKMKQNKPVYPSEMKFNGRKCDHPEQIVELFADFFESIYERNDGETNFDDIYHNEPDDSIEINLTMLDIERAINQLETKGSSVPDNLPTAIIKNCIDGIVWPLWILYQKTYEVGSIDSRLKMSRVIPVFKKKGSRINIENYRIVAISSNILKVYEIGIQSKLLAIVNPRLTNSQHGFRPRRSITTNLMNLSIAAHEAFAGKYQLDVFYGDFKNAFDKMDIRILVKKLWNFGIGKKTAKWIFEFLIERQFYVKIGDFVSRIYKSTSGVPAGSVLGPTIFLIFINDIVDNIKNSTVLLFADDIKLTCAIRSIADVRCLQNDINNLWYWCETNKLFFNPEKCSVITIRRIEDFINAVYTLGSHSIERKDENRDLGLLVDKKFTLAAHIEQSTTKARQSLGYIKRISNGQFGVRALKVLYTYVRPKLEFASVIW